MVSLRFDEEKTTEDSSGALSANADKSKNKCGRGRGHGRGCGNGREKGSKHNRDDNADQNIKCYQCGNMGHHMKNCPKRMKTKESQSSDSKSETQANIIELMATIIDSGATQHMFKNLNDFQSYAPNSTKINCAANSQSIVAEHVGTVHLNIGDRGEKTLHNVLHIPEL